MDVNLGGLIITGGVVFFAWWLSRNTIERNFEKFIEKEQARTIFVKIDIADNNGKPEYLVHQAETNMFLVQTSVLEDIPSLLFEKYKGWNVFLTTNDARMVALFLPKEANES